MTNLKDVNFGINQYCGPSVLSALTGESTDKCAAVISAVSGKKEIKAVSREHLREALKRLRFDIKESNLGGGTLFGTLYRIHTYDGLYIVFIPHHVIAIEVIGTEIFICDNHTKTPLDIKQSARLTQRVEGVWEVKPKNLPKYIKSSISLTKIMNKIIITKINEYENQEDNTRIQLGYINFDNELELMNIIKILEENC